MQTKWSQLVVLFMLVAGCGHAGHVHKPETKPEEKRKGESDQDRADRLRMEAAIRQKQTTDAAKFEKDLAIIRTAAPGDAYADFYRKVGEARLALERVTRIEDGTVERYSFMDNSTAFVVVTVKADHLREIVFEGVTP